MSIKKILLSFLMVAFMSSSITQAHTTVDKFAHAASTFGVGYMAGVTPMMWPFLPFILSNKKETISDRIFATSGFATGVAVLGLAVYGLKKLLETKKVTDSKENTRLT